MRSDQWRTLHLSRSLTQLDRPLIILCNPTEGMSRQRRELLFGFLHESARPDQVIVVVSRNLEDAELVDSVISLYDEQP